MAIKIMGGPPHEASDPIPMALFNPSPTTFQQGEEMLWKMLDKAKLCCRKTSKARIRGSCHRFS